MEMWGPCSRSREKAFFSFKVCVCVSLSVPVTLPLLPLSVCLSVSVSLCLSLGVHYLPLNVMPPQAWEELQDKHRPSHAPGASPDSSVLWAHVPICTPSHASAQVPNRAEVAVALGGGRQVVGGVPAGEPRLQPCTCFNFKTQIQQYNY